MYRRLNGSHRFVPRRDRAVACRPCPVDGCTGRRTAMQVMCGGCWFKVPKPLRDRIWRLFKTARGSAEHLQAIRQAIGAVHTRQAPSPPAA
jgi:hypothetical protein